MLLPFLYTFVKETLCDMYRAHHDKFPVSKVKETFGRNPLGGELKPDKKGYVHLPGLGQPFHSIYNSANRPDPKIINLDPQYKEIARILDEVREQNKREGIEALLNNTRIILI